MKTQTGVRHPEVEATDFTYDLRGNRVSETTRKGASFWSPVVGKTTFTYDGRDDLVSSTDTGDGGCWDRDKDRVKGKTVFVRDGVGRALTVVENGKATNRVFDGLNVVAEGDTQLVRDPFGAVQSEVTTTRSAHHWWDRAVTTSQDVLKDLLGSPIGVAVDGVVSKDLQVFGDFGDVVDAAAWDTVTGFTGQVSTGGVVEFATRTYDVASRVWLQDDSYRGTTTRSASMNRYAYVEGAPETFVDHLGFFRAAAAIQAQKLAALQAAFGSAIEELNELAGWFASVNTSWSAKQMLAHYNTYYASDDPAVRAAMDKIARNAFDGVNSFNNQQNMQAALGQLAQQSRAAYAHQVALDRAQANLDRLLAEEAAAKKKPSFTDYMGGLVDTLSIAGHGVVNFGGGAVNALADTVDLVVDVGQTTFNAVSPTCWSKTFCAAIPDIPSVPIYGDPALYKYSQTSGYLTTVAVEFVATGGAGALADGFSAAATAAKALPRLVTELPAVVNDLKAVVKAATPALKELVPKLPGLVKTTVTGVADNAASIVKNPAAFLSDLKTGLNNPVTTPGGIFGTPPPTTVVDAIPTTAVDAIPTTRFTAYPDGTIVDRTAVEAVASLESATPVGSALKNDRWHTSGAWVIDDAAENATVFPIVGGDGVPRTLIQMPGEVNGIAGRFEWILEGDELTHQFFVREGTINGIPIKP